MDSLPNEILIKIFNNLTNSKDKYTFSTISDNCFSIYSMYVMYMNQFILKKESHKKYIQKQITKLELRIPYKYLQYLERLHTLIISYKINYIEILSYTTSLRCLHLYHCEVTTSLLNLEHLCNLEELEIGIEISCPEIFKVQFSLSLIKLKLYLSSSTFYIDLKKYNKLTKLDISDNKYIKGINETDDIENTIVLPDTLEELIFKYSNLIDFTFLVNTKIKILDLSGSKNIKYIKLPITLDEFKFYNMPKLDPILLPYNIKKINVTARQTSFIFPSNILEEFIDAETSANRHNNVRAKKIYLSSVFVDDFSKLIISEITEELHLINASLVRFTLRNTNIKKLHIENIVNSVNIIVPNVLEELLFIHNFTSQLMLDECNIKKLNISNSSIRCIKLPNILNELIFHCSSMKIFEYTMIALAGGKEAYNSLINSMKIIETDKYKKYIYADNNNIPYINNCKIKNIDIIIFLNYS
ncbi:hypothetical protein [Alphaentomopoxvirus acuprea]|uniref:F-box domain-containing protein n=1 Tax=Alphaentomopoxvirus acuprea TaxID=62099 RepID=W6JIN1_9POXV|nr:hypothetical protein BA82_gp073 [Anomala cuprea entomopoxvirus]BAO49433.1 hypothetical protein [Anomala cuprea entomopoxvirus]